MRTEKEKRQHYTREQHTKANNKYNKTHTIQFNIKLNIKTDADIIEHMNQIENKRAYILGLIRKDINCKGEDHERDII